MSYYAKISDPRASRRALLESIKEPIVLLTQKKEIDELRKQKRELVLDVQEEFNDLLKILKKLEKILPQKELRQQILQQKKEAQKHKNKVVVQKPAKGTKKKTAKKTSKPKLPVQKPMTEVDRLAYTLNKIEEKLSQL